MAEREVHIWMDKIGFDEFENTAYLCTTYAETRVMIDAEQEVVHTTQTHFCQFEFGRIFVHANGPLKELPERRKYNEEYFNGDVKGWNDCLKTILGDRNV